MGAKAGLAAEVVRCDCFRYSVLRDGISRGGNAVNTIKMEGHSISYHTMATTAKSKTLRWISECFRFVKFL